MTSKKQKRRYIKFGKGVDDDSSISSGDLSDAIGDASVDDLNAGLSKYKSVTGATYSAIQLGTKTPSNGGRSNHKSWSKTFSHPAGDHHHHHHHHNQQQQQQQQQHHHHHHGIYDTPKRKGGDGDTILNANNDALAMLRKHMQSAQQTPPQSCPSPSTASSLTARRPLSASGANGDIRTNGQQVLYGGISSPPNEPLSCIGATASLNRRLPLPNRTTTGGNVTCLGSTKSSPGEGTSSLADWPPRPTSGSWLKSGGSGNSYEYNNTTNTAAEIYGIHAQIAQARANSTAQKNMLAQERGENEPSLSSLSCPVSPAHNNSSSNGRKDEVHGSSLSIASQGSSVYSTAEEKYQSEMRKLIRERDNALEQRNSLQQKLASNDNAHAHMVAVYEQSLSNMTNRLQQESSLREKVENENKQLQQHLQTKKSPTTPESNLKHQVSSDSVSSLNSLTSHTPLDDKKKKKGGWLRSSFSKFGASNSNKSNKNRQRNGSLSDAECNDSTSMKSIESSSVPNSPLPLHNNTNTSYYASPTKDSPNILDLQQQLQEKEKELADTRLENLSSAHQIDQMRETLKRMKNEMIALKSDNQRLQRLARTEESSGQSSSSAVNSSLSSPQDGIGGKLSLTDPSTTSDYLLGTDMDKDGRMIGVRLEVGEDETTDAIVMATLQVSGRTKWENLDNQLKKAFKEYVLRVDPVTNLGLDADSIDSYQIGDIIREIDSAIDNPELLPYGYLVGDSNEIFIRLKNYKNDCVDALSMETLIPKTILQRYVSLLIDHGRLMLSGPSETGKTFLASKLAEHVCRRLEKPLTSIARYKVEQRSSKELRAYLASKAEKIERNSKDAPTIILLDNVHHVLSSLPETLEPFLLNSSTTTTNANTKLPIIIGTMASSMAASLQLHHDFKWVLCATHVEPIKGLLGRYLRRRLIEREIRTQQRDTVFTNLVDWLPKVWQHVNTFLESHVCSDVTMGPKLFLGSLEADDPLVWFTVTWNYTLLPYIRDVIRNGLQTYGRRVTVWSDPAQFVLDTFPWSRGSDMDGGLLRLRPEDVGFDTAPLSINNGGGGGGGGHQQQMVNNSSPAPARHSIQQDLNDNNDPLTNMLMRLQEAAVTNCQSTDSENGLDENSKDDG